MTVRPKPKAKEMDQDYFCASMVLPPHTSIIKKMMDIRLYSKGNQSTGVSKPKQNGDSSSEPRLLLEASTVGIEHGGPFRLGQPSRLRESSFPEFYRDVDSRRYSVRYREFIMQGERGCLYGRVAENVIMVTVALLSLWMLSATRFANIQGRVLSFPALRIIHEPTPFRIQIIYSTPLTDEQKQSFEDAKAAWEKIFAKGFGSDVRAGKGTTLCSQSPLENDLVVHDLAIFVSILSIDGPGNILGQAGPCAYDKSGRVRAGIMRFDIDDLTNHFQATVKHEMGHVFGLGSSWEDRKLLSPDGITPIMYSGEQGNLGHKEVGGEGNAAIVENEGGAGTARSHWKESVYGTEIMTGFLVKGSPQPISKLTVRALADLGFDVDLSKADEFTIDTEYRRNLRGADPAPMKLPAGPMVATGDDIFHMPSIVLEPK